MASHLEEQFAAQLDAYGITYDREQMLIPGRKFRFDFVIPQAALVCEVEGGTVSASARGRTLSRTHRAAPQTAPQDG